ncbi:hypothetical protein EUGRSUZ_I01747 [Eucalyptus grandis]|uniref:Uncharacterized protein n=2 Tax=Eucalyptus grandis TaxID=71139 RepID=A0ACC3JGH1_EUCGR|nr:hypothetical protein EUGRSUZ_I01747 [Eucalyptus grandis]
MESAFSQLTSVTPVDILFSLLCPISPSKLFSPKFSSMVAASPSFFARNNEESFSSTTLVLDSLTCGF